MRGNHNHLLRQTPEANLVAGMKWLSLAPRRVGVGRASGWGWETTPE
ncbi:MAG: hypothetical protein WCQ21_01295 [Verrucomicrobiota bacterium]